MKNPERRSNIKSEVSPYRLSARTFSLVFCVCLLLLNALPSLLFATSALGASSPAKAVASDAAVNSAAITTTLTSAPNPSTVGQSVTFTATVTQPTGNTAVSIVDFAFTPKVITISVGDSVTWTNNGNITHTSTSTGGVWDSGDLTHGQSFTQVFTQTGTFNYFCMHHPGSMTGTINVVAPSVIPTGDVTFKDGSTTLAIVNLSGNTATYITSSLNVSSHLITAVYNGDANFAASTSNIVTQVVNAPPAVSFTMLASTPNPSTLGQSVTFTATVNPVSPPAAVSIVDFAFVAKVITVPLGTTVTWTNNGNSTHTTTSTTGVWNSGDLTHGQSFSLAFTQTGTYNYFCMHHPSIMTGTINVVAATTSPTGNVTFKDGSTTLATVNLSGNAATYITSSLNMGSHLITAVYNGDANFAASTSNVVTQVVNQPIVVTPASISVAGGSGQSTPINTAFLSPLAAVVRDANGNPLASIVVTFTAPGTGASGTFAGGGLTAIVTTNAQGIAIAPTFTANSTVGSYNVLATVAGVTTPATFILVNTPAGSASGYTYYLPFLANNYQPNGASGGSFTTYFVFQNPNNTMANINLRYFDTNGSVVNLPAGTCAMVMAHAECIAPNPFANNAKGEGILVSDQPLSVIVAEGTPYGGSAYPVGAGASNSLIAPVIIRGGLADFITQLSVFNGGDTTVTGTVKFYQQDGTYIPAADKQLYLAPHTTAIFDQTGDTMLGNSFYGWAQVTGNVGSQLAAQVLEQRPSTRFVAIANAQATPRTNLFAPAIFNGAFNGFVTGVNFVNPNAAVVTVNVTYYRNDGTAFPAPAFTVPAYGVVGVFDRGVNGPGLPTGGLPSGFYGSAIVTTSGGGITMLVNEQGGLTPGGTAQSGTYSGAASGATTVGLPVIDNGAFGGYITGATILNTANATVGGTIQYYDLNGNAVGTAKTFSVGAYGSYAVFQGDPAQGLSPGFAGTAIVTVTSGPTSSLLTTTNAQSNNFFYTYTEPNQ